MNSERRITAQFTCVFKTRMRRLLTMLLSVSLVVTMAWVPISVLENSGVERAFGAGNTITVDDSSTASDLVERLVGTGVNASNIKTAGSSQQYGTFSNGDEVFGIDTGIILSTGRAKDVEPASVDKPNSTSNKYTDMKMPGDNDLDTLLTGSAIKTNDACVLEFDFVPETEYLTFNYVFASEEYNEYVGSGFNDVFAFYINKVNYALVPGTGKIVSINTINYLVSPQYYINNCPHFHSGQTGLPLVPESEVKQTEMDGFTVVLQIQAKVTPHTTNHIKLAIADVNDFKLDANVLISDLRSELPAVSIMEPTEKTVSETAGSVSFILERDITLGSSTVDFNLVEGSAKPGVDYTDISGSVTFADGEATKTVTIPITNRSGSYQGDREFTVELENPNQCRIVDPSEGLVTILDTDPKPTTFTVTEKFVDTAGNPVDSVDLADRQTEVESSFTATSVPVSHTPANGANYIYLGYKTGTYSTGDTLTSGTPSAVAVSAPLTIFYVYQATRPLTISKVVTGDYADHKNGFNFTLSFQDSTNVKLPSGTQFSYTGGIVAGSGATAPANGTLTLNSEGSCTVSLKHGQTITLSNVALGYRVRIVEERVTGYTATYVDSTTGTPRTSFDTDFLDMTNANRIVAFTNALVEIPPTGIADQDMKMPMLAIAASLMLAGGMLAARLVHLGRRSRKNG